MTHGTNSRAIVGLTTMAVLTFTLHLRGEPAQPDSAATRRAERLFTLKVLPVLKAKCYGCHGDDADDVKGEFDVRSRELRC